MGRRCSDEARLRARCPAYVLTAFALLAAAQSMAQVENASDAPPAPLSTRALRDADSPMRWIKLHSELARQSEERKAAASAAAVAKSTRRNEVAAVAKAAAAASQATSKPARAAADSRTSGASDESLDSGLVIIDDAQPEWDEEDLAKLKKGRVVVRFHVAEDGYLSRIQIVESTSPRLTGPAMAAVMQWRFQPIKQPRVATVEFGFDITKQRGIR